MRDDHYRYGQAEPQVSVPPPIRSEGADVTEVDPSDPYKGLRMTDDDPRRGFPTTGDKTSRPAKSWQGEMSENICIMLTFLGLAAAIVILVYVIRTT